MEKCSLTSIAECNNFFSDLDTVSPTNCNKGRLTIVGAGIQGLLVALEFRLLGWQVTIFDSGESVGTTGASYGTHRLIHPFIKDEEEQESVQVCLTLWQKIAALLGGHLFHETGVLLIQDDGPEQINYLIGDCLTLTRKEAIAQMPALNKGRFRDAVFAPSYGVLMASNIVDQLVNYLRSIGVALYGGQKVIHIDPKVATVKTAQGKVYHADKVVIATGTGTRELLANHKWSQDLSQQFKAMQCFVVYGQLQGCPYSDFPAWLTSGESELWGMPPLAGGAMKLGCGALTQPASALPVCENKLIAQFKQKYQQLFPTFTRFEAHSLGQNHWTHNAIGRSILRHDNCYLMATCLGSGFKLAPALARQLVHLILR